jgi:hypothetical protein
VSENLKSNKEIILEAIKKSPDAMIHADYSLKKDKDFIMKAFKINLYLL